MKGESAHSTKTESMSESAMETTKINHLQAKIDQLWNWFVERMERSNDLEIHQVNNDSSSTEWLVYDPMKRCKVSLSSEVEVRRWLEQRFYQ